MPTWLIIILLAILAVGLFVLAMSLTLIFKGHHIDSEISTNETCANWVSNAPFRRPANR